jgi:hypothetical protein
VITDTIARVEVDPEGRLHVHPATATFPFAYREALQVAWEPSLGSLHSPVPRKWSYLRWFQQILAVAFAQGVCLVVSPATVWSNVAEGIRSELESIATPDTW